TPPSTRRRATRRSRSRGWRSSSSRWGCSLRPDEAARAGAREEIAGGAGDDRGRRERGRRDEDRRRDDEVHGGDRGGQAGEPARARAARAPAEARQTAGIELGEAFVEELFLPPVRRDHGDELEREE